MFVLDEQIKSNPGSPNRTYKIIKSLSLIKGFSREKLSTCEHRAGTRPRHATYIAYLIMKSAARIHIVMEIFLNLPVNALRTT